MKIAAEDYAPMKAFFGWMLENAMPLPARLLADHHPMALLEVAERKSVAAARASLAVAIGDVVELFADMDRSQSDAIDQRLRQAGLPTLTQVRARHWNKIRSILKRGHVRNEGEFQALRNVVEEMMEGETPRAWAILADYENGLVGRAVQ